MPVLRNVGERNSSDLRAELHQMRADAAARAIPPENCVGPRLPYRILRMIGGALLLASSSCRPKWAIIGAGQC